VYASFGIRLHLSERFALPLILLPVSLLSIQQVVKRYATKVAVDHVNLDIPEGSVFGLLGPNGAGKTSLIRMITHITLPDSGQILFKGKPLSDEHQAQMGYMPEERGLYRKMKIGEVLEYLLELKGLSSAAAKSTTTHWLERFELGDWRHRKVEELSKGMQQKVQFIATVAHKPPLLILDEPFSGLDPLNAQLIEQVIAELSREGHTIIFSTHRMEQVEEFCQRIALINNGGIVLHDDVKAARLKYRKPIYVIEAEGGITPDALPAGAHIIEQKNGAIRVRLPDGSTPQQLIAHLNSRVELTRFELFLPSLRDIFIEVVGRDNLPQEALAVPVA
jgi:ABC-2 type transport system ATP-binding protein